MKLGPHLPVLGLLCVMFQPVAASFQMPSYFEVIIPRKLEPSQGDTRHRVSYAISAEGQEYVVILLPNRGLVSKDSVLFTYSETGSLIQQPMPVREDCYYQGSVQGRPSSLVALSICSGLRGFLQIGTLNYKIEPVDIFSTFHHLIYQVKRVEHEPDRCLTVFPSITYPYQLRPTTHTVSGDLRSTKYLEIYVVVDNAGYKLFESNDTMVVHEVIEILNLADAMFLPLNSHVVLVGLELWSKEDLIVFSDTTKQMLREFSEWNGNDRKPQNNLDVTYLFTGKSGLEENGHTYLGTICRGALHATGLLVLHTSRFISEIAVAFTHEIGHNVGMRHDGEQEKICTCESKFCIMGVHQPSMVAWSECSVSDYDEFLAAGRGLCLQNIPSVESFFTMPYCGNKLVEEGEQCDCGTQNECASDPCCDSTCKLKSGAQCGFGECCIQCQFITLGTPCRRPVSECDLAEYCTGTSNMCPQDVYAQDGTPCNDKQSYCFSNTCYDYGKHCRKLFGKGAIVAAHECFSTVNAHSKPFGNCGLKSDNTLEKCEASNVMCGRVQCENISQMLLYPAQTVIHQTPVGSRWCWTLSNDYDLPDIGAVEDGASCGIGKVCVKRTCLPVSVLSYDCDIEKSCSGHGVCNNEKHCHCSKEWAPPDCKFKGFGGSIDSGPLIKGSFISYVPPEQERIYGMPAYTNIASVKTSRWVSLLLLFLVSLIAAVL